MCLFGGVYMHTSVSRARRLTESGVLLAVAYGVELLHKCGFPRKGKMEQRQAVRYFL